MVATLTDLDRLYVNFTLPEQAASQVAAGQTVQVTVDAFSGTVFEAKLTAIEPQINADTRTLRLQATLDNPGHKLLPGMFANAALVLPSQAEVLSVPETAVDYSLYGDSVFLVHEDGASATVKRTFVKTGDRFDNRVAILSGLKAGDRVVASGQLKLTSDAPVTITDSDALRTPVTVPTN
jgi:multidrug efflux system membrane fusion protein